MLSKKYVIERETPEIPEAIRYNSTSITNRAMLSRAMAGIRGACLIINLPESLRAVRESLEFIIDSIILGLDILTGGEVECTR